MNIFCVFSILLPVEMMTATESLKTHEVDEQTFENITEIPIDIQPDLDDYCWSQQLDRCNIIGNFTRLTIGLSFPVSIECSMQLIDINTNEAQKPHLEQYFYDHFQHVEVISLNGCGVNTANRTQNDHILGIEFIPDPLSVRHLTLEMFKVHGEPNSGAFEQFKNMKTLLLTNNKIQRLNETSLNGLSLLEELILQENHIQAIQSNTFKPCDDSLKKLIIQESDLILGELTPLQKITDFIVSTKQMNWTALTIGIDSMNLAVVSHIKQIVFNSTSAPRIFKNLLKFEVTFCNLMEFPLDRYPRLLHFNVSNNELRNISIKLMQMLGLQTLDISNNRFISIDGTLLANLWDLEYLYATHNQIIGVNSKAFQKNSNLKVVDLSFNRLKRLTVDPSLFVSAKQVKLVIDQNPFNCAWVNEYYGLDPHIFQSRLVYQKDFSDLNIKGLRCLHYSGDYRYHSHLYDDDDDLYHNGKSRRPPHPVEILRRNPKHTALVTICILVIGVSCLLISLFLYVKYRTLTTTLNQNSDYFKDKDYFENRPDIIQHRMFMALANESSTRLLDSTSRPIHNDFASIEFKEPFEPNADKRKSSLTNRFESVPIGTKQKVVFDIESDSLGN